MSQAKVFVTRALPDDVTKRLLSSYDATLNESDRLMTAEEVIAGAKGHDAILTTPTEKFTPDVIAALPDEIKILATFSVGYEHIDLEAAKDRGVKVTNTPDVLTDATADIALLCLLGASRRAFEGQQMLRQGKWVGWSTTQLMGHQLTGKTLGILGMGRIGQGVAQRAKAFGMSIRYSNRSRLSPELEAGAIFHADPEEMLPHCQFLSLNAPARPETHHFLNEKRISLLPDQAIVVNTARGTLVKDEALISALKSGKIAAAGLDVFEGEPKFDPRYAELANAYLLPHMGSATIETRNAMGFKCLDNLDAFFAGQTPPDALV